jgi:hypothetical protein
MRRISGINVGNMVLDNCLWDRQFNCIMQSAKLILVLHLEGQLTEYFGRFNL